MLRDSIVSCFDADTKVAQHKAEIFEEQVPDKQLLRDADKLGWFEGLLNFFSQVRLGHAWVLFPSAISFTQLDGVSVDIYDYCIICKGYVFDIVRVDSDQWGNGNVTLTE